MGGHAALEVQGSMQGARQVLHSCSCRMAPPRHCCCQRTTATPLGGSPCATPSRTKHLKQGVSHHQTACCAENPQVVPCNLVAASGGVGSGHERGVGQPNTPTSALEHIGCVPGCAVGAAGAQRVAQGMAWALRCEPSWWRSSMPCACARAINIAMQAARAQCWLAVAPGWAWRLRLHLVYMCTWCMQAVNVGPHQLEGCAANTWPHGYHHLWAPGCCHSHVRTAGTCGCQQTCAAGLVLRPRLPCCVCLDSRDGA